MDTKQRIVQATITCIAQNGLKNTTSRDIAAAGSVNVAAINYHFGTKQRLIDLAMRSTVDTALEELSEILHTPGRSFRNRLWDFYVALLRRGRAQPNITRAHLYGSLIDGEAPGPYLQGITVLLRETLDDLQPDDSILASHERARAIESGLNAVLMRCLHPGLCDLGPPGSDRIEDEARRLVRLIQTHV